MTDQKDLPPVYLFPGLGADARLFRYLDTGSHPRVVINCLPAGKEDLEGYAQRLSQQFDQTKPFILLGVSLGGILCQHLAKHPGCLGLILISTVKSKHEIPRWMRAAASAGLHHLARPWLLKRILLVVRWFIGSGSRESYQVFRDMLFETPPQLFKWALPQVLRWEGADLTKPWYHLHGTNDHLFPLRNIKDAMPVEGGKHFMVFNLAEKVNPLVKECLQRLSAK